MKRYPIIFLAILFLVFTNFMATSCAADSLQDLQAKAAKIKTGPTGDTDVTVKALMGEPRAVRTDERIVGAGKTLKRLIYSYGPNEEIMVIFDAEYKYVRAVK